MISAREYDATLEKLNATKDRIWEYNKLRPSMLKERNELLWGILGKSDEDTFINQPCYCQKLVQKGSKQVDVSTDGIVLVGNFMATPEVMIEVYPDPKFKAVSMV